MKQKLSKSNVQEKIKEFFKDIRNRTPKEIKKIKKLAMSKNLPLKKLRKTFCKNCFAPYKTPKIRIKDKIKTIVCEKCGSVNRYKLTLLKFSN